MSETITCPSGLSGNIRGLKVKEFNILANRRLAKGGGQVDAILAACWMKTVDPGPYDFGEQTVDWNRVLQGDRFYALLRVRALSLGTTYAFGVACHNDGCRQRFEWEIDLDVLPVRSLSDASRAAFHNGNRFETTLPGCRRSVWFRLPVGSDERKFAKVRQSNPDRLWSAMLSMRILEVEGVKDIDRRRFIEDLEVADAEHLRVAFDEADCGVETTIEIECPECLTTQDAELPFDQRFLLGPDRHRRKGSLAT